MDPLTGAALIGGGIDAATQFGGMMLQNHYQKKAETRANEEWQRRFDVENLYNLPSAQAKRLNDAGINPLAQMIGTSPTPSASGSTNNPQSPSQQIDTDFANLVLSSQRLKLDEKLVNAEAELKGAQAKRLLSQEEQDWWRIEFARQESERQERLVSLKEKLGNEEWRIAKVEADLAEYSFENKKAMSDQEVEQMYLDYAIGIWQIEHTKQDIEESKAVVQDYADQAVTRAVQRALMKSEIEVNEEECNELIARCARMSEETKLILKQQGKTDAEIERIQAEAKQIEAYTKEIPKNAKAQRYGTYVDSTVGALTKVADSTSRIIGAIGTGGVSEILETHTTTTETFNSWGDPTGSSVTTDTRNYKKTDSR